MIKYVYSDRENTTQRERKQAPTMHTNVSTYAQTLMIFHEASPVPNNSSNKRLKIRLHDNTMSSQWNSTPEDSIPLHLPPHEKTVTFIEIDNPKPVETVATEEHVTIQTKRNPGRSTTTRRRSAISGRGDNRRGGPYRRGETNGRGYNQYQHTTQSSDWRDTDKTWCPTSN